MKTFILLFLSFFVFFNSTTYAASDPRQRPNNKFGIGILSPESDLKDASVLVNTNGDWGWVVVVINKGERDVARWQSILNNLNKEHLIPIIRIATKVDPNGSWQKPDVNDAQEWADFLSKLYFPTKNRYVQVYNEVNSSKEWGGDANPTEYAQELSKTANTLKAKSDDFFILESPMDLSAGTSNDSIDAGTFFKKMNDEVPDIFMKIDGWASHPYPNPNFTASPLKSGRTGIDGYKWELGQISGYIKGKKLPIFITETGWRRTDDGTLDDKKISEYYKIAFDKVWDDKNIVAVCPFILSYPDDQFYQFSFKSNDSSSGNIFFDYYFKILNLTKTKGEPERINLASEPLVSIPEPIISSTQSDVSFKVKNSGNYIWDTNHDLAFTGSSAEMIVSEAKWNKEEVYPGEEAIVSFKIQPNSEGQLPLSLNIKFQNESIANKTISLNSVSYLSFLLGTIKKISMGNIFYSSAKLMSL